MTKARRLISEGLRSEIETLEHLLQATERDARKVARAHESLLRRERQALARSRRAGATADDRRALRTVRTARRRSEKLKQRLAENVAGKRKELAALRRDAGALDRGLNRLRQGLAPRAGAPAVTGDQLRCARALLQLSQPDMAAMLDLSTTGLRALEKQEGRLTLDPDTATRIARALSRAGVELIDRGFYAGTGGPGLRLKRGGLRVVQDNQGAKRAGAARRRKRRRAVAA